MAPKLLYRWRPFFRDAARYIGIARKITIYLHCKKNCAYDNVDPSHQSRTTKNLVDYRCNPVRDGDLLEETKGNEIQPARRLRQSWMAWIGKLRKQMTSSFDGSRLQLREVSYEERKVGKAARRFKLFPIDVEVSDWNV